MNVLLYKFTKRNNSTLLPTPQDSQKIITCQLKDDTSFLNPVLRLGTNLTSGVFSPSAYNYCQIPYWERFYYITDWKWINGTWEAYCMVDPLASFKTEIGNTSAYIVRCADSNNFNGNVIDTFYPTTTNASISHVACNPPWHERTFNNGCFVVGIINNDNTTNRMGSVVYYALYNSEFRTLMQYLFSSSIFNASNITEIGEGLYKSMFNPFQYFVSVMWVPFFPNEIAPGSSVEINVGYWNTGCTGKIISNIILEDGFHSSSALPVHPQISRGDYLNHEPFTRVTAYIPPFGEIPVDTMYMKYGSNNYLYVHYVFDVVTGICEAYLSITNGNTATDADVWNIFTMRNAQLGVPIQISQIMSDYLSSLSGAAGAISNAFSFNIAGIFENIASAVSSAMPKVSNLGSNGTLINIKEPGYVVVENYRQVDVNRTEFGRPLCSTKVINTLSGYIKTGEADHSFSATKTESDAINNYLSSGFFYE